MLNKRSEIQLKTSAVRGYNLTASQHS